MSRPTTLIFPHWKFWKKACWNFAEPSCWLPTIDSCWIAFPPRFWVWMGGAERFADYSQWNAWKNERGQKKNSELSPRSTDSAGNATTYTSQTSSNQIKKKLSYLEAREYSTIEQEIADAEQRLQSHRETMEDPTIATDAARLEKAMADVTQAEGCVDELYLRWTELEAK